MQYQKSLLALGALTSAVQAQYGAPPPPVLLNSTKSGVLPTLPTPFNGTLTLQGAIISKAPFNASYTPLGGPAKVQSNLPAATYMATLPGVAFDTLFGTVPSGTVMAYSNQGDTGVTFKFNITGFPSLSMYGPFGYHIHDMPVPSDGNCTATMGHFDPTNAGEYYTCPASNAVNCQAGDLASKHGAINGTSQMTTFVDQYLSTDPSSPYFFGARSLVWHSANRTRITCANFMMVSANGTTPPATATTTGPAVVVSTGGATRALAGTASGVLAMVMAVLML